MISEAKRAYNRAYYEKNKEARKEAARKWHREHRDRSLALLCKRCNSGLGFFRDDWRLLLTATRYVQLRKEAA